VTAAVVAHHPREQVDDRAGDQQQRQQRPPEPIGDEDRQRGEGEQPGAERPRKAPLQRRGRRVVGRHEDEAEQVGEHPEPAREREDHERDPDRERIDVEMAPDATRDARDQAIAGRASQAPRVVVRLWWSRIRLRWSRRRVGHGSNLAYARARHHWESP
jgi:hypothetical protein